MCGRGVTQGKKVCSYMLSTKEESGNIYANQDWAVTRPVFWLGDEIAGQKIYCKKVSNWIAITLHMGEIKI